MSFIVERPLLLFVLTLLLQLLAALIGDLLRRRLEVLDKDKLDDLDTVRNAAMTLLALIIGFSFSMALSRYDQRKIYEEGEANAIGTEYVRADLLPSAVAASVRDLLRKYLDRRIAFYLTRGEESIALIGVETAKLQAELWSAVVPVAAAQADPITALAVAGMNDVLNSQGYTQASWWNRIPVEGWTLMVLIAVACNMLVGYSGRRSGYRVLAIMPVIVSISFFLISDIDSPRRGVIRVLPQNLIALAEAIKSH